MTKDNYSITVYGTNSAAVDVPALNAAIATLNTWARGTLWVEGFFEINAALTPFAKAIKLRSDTGAHFKRVAGTGNSFFVWMGPGIWSMSQSHYNITANAGDDFFVLSDAVVNRGDVVILYSEDILQNVAPHFMNGATWPGSMHKIQHYDASTKRAYVESALPDSLLTNAKAAVFTPLLEDIVISNITFESAIDSCDYALILYGTNRAIVENVHMVQNGGGALLVKFGLNTLIQGLTIEGTKAAEGIYGVLAAICNGFVMNGFNITGTRHAFTTTAWLSNNLTRIGGPLHVRLCNGVVNSPLKQPLVGSRTTIPLDTHAEGFDIVFDGITVTTSANAIYCASTRCRNTTYQNCNFRGKGGLGVLVHGPNCLIQTCTFEDLNTGIVIEASNQEDFLASKTRDNLRVVHNTFKDIYGQALRVEAGNNATFCHNLVQDSGTYAGGLPHYSRAVVGIKGGTGHKLCSNTIIKHKNSRVSFDIADLTPADVIIAGNTIIGYEKVISITEPTLAIGRFLGQRHITADPETDTFTAYYHNMANDTKCLLEGKVLPEGLSSSVTYSVTNATLHTFQLNLNNALATFSTAGEGLRCKVGNVYVGNGKSLVLDCNTDTFTYPKHGLQKGDYGYMRGVVMPTMFGGKQLDMQTKYFVINATENTFQLSDIQNGFCINFITNGVGLGFDATCPSLDNIFTQNFKS